MVVLEYVEPVLFTEFKYEWSRAMNNPSFQVSMSPISIEYNLVFLEMSEEHNLRQSSEVELLAQIRVLLHSYEKGTVKSPCNHLKYPSELLYISSSKISHNDVVLLYFIPELAICKNSLDTRKHLFVSPVMKV